MSRRAGSLGATIYAAPLRTARVVGFITPGLEVEGDIIAGACVHDEPRWVHIEGYVPMIRLSDEPE